MKLLSKKETLAKSIPLMAVMAAINVLLSFMTTFVPFLGVFLIIFLPLTSAIIEISCKDRYFLIYAFATLGLSIVVSLSSFDFTLFYVLPSIVTGYIFGLMQKKNISNYIAIFVAACAQTIISFAFIPLIKLITEHNLIQDFRTIFHLEESTYFSNLLILFFFIIAIVQTLLSFIVINNELRKFKETNIDSSSQKFVCSIMIFASCILILIFKFFYTPISYLCLGFAWYFTFVEIYFYGKERNKHFIILSGIAIFINIILYAAFNSYILHGVELLMIGLSPLFISFISQTLYFLQKQKDEIE